MGTVSEQCAFMAKPASSILCYIRKKGHQTMEEGGPSPPLALVTHAWSAVTSSELPSTRERWTSWCESNKGP